MAITATVGGIVFGGPADGDGDRFTLKELFGWTGAPVDLVSVDKPLSPGAVVAHGRYKGRTVIISGHAIATNADTVWRVRNKLEACVTPTTDYTLTVAEPSPGTTKTLTVRLADALRVRPAGTRTVEFEISLFAANPTKV